MGVYTVPAQDIVYGGNTYHIGEFQFTNEVIHGMYQAQVMQWYGEGNDTLIFNDGGYIVAVNTENRGGRAVYTLGGVERMSSYTTRSFTFNNKTVYYSDPTGASMSLASDININLTPKSGDTALCAWLVAYGNYTGYQVTYDLENCTGADSNPISIAQSALITNMSFTPAENGVFNSGSVYIDGTGISPDDPVLFTWDYETGDLRLGVITSNIIVHVSASVDPYADLEISGETDIPDADTIALPALPTLSAISSGIIGLFNPTLSQMRLLADYMWTDFGGQGQTEVDVLKEIVQAIKRTIANPLDYIFGLNIIPSQGLSVGTATEIRFGFTNTGVSMPRLTSQFFTVDCGTLSFDTLCGDTFLDYAPYSKFSIYLPYIGIKDVNANDFVGHTIGVVYHGDVVTGGITAYITKDGSVMYQYSGCCALNLPLSTDSWGAVLSGAVQVATALVAGGVSGGAAGVGEAAMAGAANVAANPSLLSPSVARSGAISGAAGAMGVQTPYIIREAVRFHSTEKFNTVTGYPSYYYRSLSSVHGYTKVYDVHLRNIGGTENEIKEIESLLKSGVIL